MVRVVFENGLDTVAQKIASCLNGEAVKLENAMDAPDILEGIDTVGLVYFKTGRDVSENIVRFIKKCMGTIELKDLGYLFSLCVCNSDSKKKGGSIAKPDYSLRVINRLCSKIGCLPSYSNIMLMDDEKKLDVVCKELEKETIKLPKGSPFVGLYMKLTKKFTREF